MLAGYALLVVISALVAAIGLYAIVYLRRTYAERLDVGQRLVETADALRFEARDGVAHYRGLLLYPEEQKYFQDRLEQNRRQFDELIERMRKLVTTDSGRSLVAEIATLHQKHVQGQEKVLALGQRGQRAEAAALNVKEVRPLTLELDEKLNAFRQRQVQRGAELRAEAEGLARRVSYTLVVSSLIAVALGLGIAILLTRAITRPLRESVTRIGSATAEILATTVQAASSAAETASTVSETSTTVEEVKQTAQLSAQKAKAVSDGAQRAAQVSQKGRSSVGGAVQGMNEIRERVEFVAESVVRLSEQSQSIGEIIAAVSDLADQSNLLAVNGAIEAAKAGEQGKGFAVVAQEVKSLAEQSKQATAQVRTILGEIQKATSASVLAAEQATKAVEAGVRLSTEAGEAIQALVETIAESAQAATQIAASSQQQLVGMEQVARAIENIRQATAQNATGTKQMEQAAQNLTHLGERLRGLIDKVPA
jgi:methyl-accepting chemotaxis protein